MSNNASSTRFAKYAPLRGIANVAEHIFNGSWTLRHAARHISVTSECVRQDLAAYVGAANYKQRVKARKDRLKQSREPRTLSAAQALQYLSTQQAHQIGPAPRFLKHIIEQSLSAGVRLSLRVCMGRRPVLLTPEGRPISIRVLFPDGSVRENALGLHRINISRLRHQQHPIVVFILAAPPRTCCYVFRAKDLTSTDSVVLRYRALHRPSRYSQGLNNWKAIAGC